MSFNSPWEWTDTQFGGFKDQLEDLDVEYKVVQMDTKKNNTDELKKKVAKEAMDLIESWKPDLVYTTDDDAQAYITKNYINKDIPFVFSGVNQSAKFYGFDQARNITGILEIEHSIESINLLKQIVPGVKKIAVIYDEGAQWPPMMERLKAREHELKGVQIVSYEKLATFEELQKKLTTEYPGKVDAVGTIGIFNLKDKDGKNVDQTVVMKWIAENSKLPDFSFWKDRVTNGTLASVTISGPEQGKAAGKLAREILVNGKAPNSLPIEPTEKGAPTVSLAKANKMGIQIESSTLLSSEVVKDFLWNQK